MRCRRMLTLACVVLAAGIAWSPTLAVPASAKPIDVEATGSAGQTLLASTFTSRLSSLTTVSFRTLSSVVVTGSPVQGNVLTTSKGSWLSNPTSYAYHWKDCNRFGRNCSMKRGATRSTYLLTSADVGHTIRSLVTATASTGSTSVESAPTAVVVPDLPPLLPPIDVASPTVTGTTQGQTPSGPTAVVVPVLPPLLPPVDVASPTVSGTTQQGQTLSASTGSWLNNPTSYSYQWQDCDGSGSSCSNISSATQSTYTLASSDVGHTMRAVVTATNSAGSSSATSAQTTAVSLPPGPSDSAPPAVTGQTVQGQTLSTSNGSWSGSPTSYAYRWQDCNSSGESCVSISGATSSSYTLQASDVGSTIRSVVTATNSGGSASATSDATATVSGAAPANTTAPAVTGQTVQGQTLSTSNGSWSGSPTSYAYRWQDCNSSGESCVSISGATSSSYTLQASDVGSTIRSVVTATNSGGSASATSDASATVSGAAPGNTMSCDLDATTANYQSQIAAASPGQVVCLCVGGLQRLYGDEQVGSGGHDYVCAGRERSRSTRACR